MRPREVGAAVEGAAVEVVAVEVVAVEVVAVEVVAVEVVAVGGGETEEVEVAEMIGEEAAAVRVTAILQVVADTITLEPTTMATIKSITIPHMVRQIISKLLRVPPGSWHFLSLQFCAYWSV